MDSTISICQQSDLAELFELFGKVYPNNPRLCEPNYFDWQYLQTPFSSTREYTFLLQRCNSEITGFIGYFPVSLRSAGKVQPACWLYNWWSQSQNPNALTLLTKAFSNADTRLMIGMTDEATQIYSALRIPILRKIPRLLGFLQPTAIESLFEKLTNKDAETVRASSARLLANKKSSAIARCTAFDPNEHFRFPEQWNIEHYCERNGRFLNWRFCDIPQHSYRIIRSEKGYAVYRIQEIMHSRASVTKLVDWNFYGAAAEAALAFILEDSLAHGSIFIDFFCTSQQLLTELETLGFVREEAIQGQTPYLFRPLYYKDAIPLAIDLPPHRTTRNINFASWYISMADGDLERRKL